MFASVVVALMFAPVAVPAFEVGGSDEGVCINCFHGYLGPECGPSGNAAGINCRIETTVRCFLGICIETDTCKVDPGPQNCSPPGGEIPEGLDAEIHAAALAIDGSLATSESELGPHDDVTVDCRGQIVGRFVSLQTAERVRRQTTSIRL